MYKITVDYSFDGINDLKACFKGKLRLILPTVGLQLAPLYVNPQAILLGEKLDPSWGQFDKHGNRYRDSGFSATTLATLQKLIGDKILLIEMKLHETVTANRAKFFSQVPNPLCLEIDPLIDPTGTDPMPATSSIKATPDRELVARSNLDQWREKLRSGDKVSIWIDHLNSFCRYKIIEVERAGGYAFLRLNPLSQAADKVLLDLIFPDISNVAPADICAGIANDFTTLESWRDSLKVGDSILVWTDDIMRFCMYRIEGDAVLRAGNYLYFDLAAASDTASTTHRILRGRVFPAN